MLPVSRSTGKRSSVNSTRSFTGFGLWSGASLQHWIEHYQVQQLSALELQPALIQRIHQHLPQLAHIQQGSFLDLNQLYSPEAFDVILCIDAAYHSDLRRFLDAVKPVLKTQGRLGFHYLVLSEKWRQLSDFSNKNILICLKLRM
jgi:cyclopropane fatty-acyl-phospholipid synthase-like methyltransferase